MTFEVAVDPFNPGHFFAACGLFELSHRLAPEVEAHFGDRCFMVRGGPSLPDVLDALQVAGVAVEQDDSAAVGDDDEEDGTDRAAPLRLAPPFDLRVDWWLDRAGRELKVWAGTMDNGRIARAMLAAMASPDYRTPELLERGQVVPDPENPRKKVEPFYFDARRAPNSHARDAGFSSDELGMAVTAFPASEFLCLIGLQRFRPSPHPAHRRIFDYRAWLSSLPIELAALAVPGAVSVGAARRYRFENWFRTGQRKHKAFRQATLVPQGA